LYDGLPSKRENMEKKGVVGADEQDTGNDVPRDDNMSAVVELRKSEPSKET
jgi:hypothetical protein